MATKQESPSVVGARSYQEWRKSLFSTPQKRQIYQEEAVKMDLWLQLVEARLDAGITQAELAKRLGISQAQVARLEKRGYDTYTVTSLTRYVQALGEGFGLEIRVKTPGRSAAAHMSQPL